MSDYDTRDQRAAAEAEFDRLPTADITVAPNASIVYSLRVKGAELDELKAAADAAGQSVSAYIREAALARARAGESGVVDLIAALQESVAQLRHKMTDSAA